MMYHYVDVNQIVNTLYCEDQTEFLIEFPVYCDQPSFISPGEKLKIPTLTYVFNIPKTHFVEFNGITTNISISTYNGVIHPDTYGLIYITLVNTSLELREVPKHIKLGSIKIRKYLCNNEA